ncbi:MAG: protein-export membrane protein SecD [Candidatus Yanofskybacteria bacterium RIFCSPHIGHO2_01_FULL_42_12]|uniref:Protein translocase subunit SecD n=1 Tax=Candidatus Yanofskybacteria bacterium RIFCSPLOWO2_01_FULL_42_49 TaxID=1802694 RepID=A0A1F8G9Q1_9BACT|nr:MAG: protein-export membrane protein SecD [Candidatus Yanofskybacteria bacterium RIFCSPHIGHO2_01_FULL_42_12]OGN22092.1 MAG: protein-export membrane protein SecD [Candidatus Yanofskybacteria bacterium RIFCSPLOWO2_01_FULL_42_49]
MFNYSLVKNSYFLITLIVASLFLLVFVYPQGVEKTAGFLNWKLETRNWKLPPFRLGLDLLGGTHLVYEADLNQVGDLNAADAMQGVRDVVERRVNFFGVSEPVVQVSGSDRLIVELAGISDVNQAIQLIGETPFLEFKEETDGTRDILDAQSRGERLSEEPFLATGLNGRHLERAQLVFDPQTNIPQVSLQLTGEGAELFSEITRRNIGKLVAIYLDGMPISIPVVQTEIPDGSAVISGKFTPQEAKLLVTRLNSGALPVPIKLISQQTIGASLGQESLVKSLVAGVYGLIAVALFMILFYRLPGVVSVAALVVYVLIVLAFYKLIPVTLTLAGIAGFILSLGMAVDANVLIFARMREELKAGKTLTQSMEEGFKRAWLSVRDSHVTTLIGALVLYMFTTSMVKGFALTLGIGVLVSLFTATIVTRKILLLFAGQRWEKKRWMF